MVLAANVRHDNIAISMDGKGAWRDNVFVERLWRSVKYEEVYLRADDSVGEARLSLGRYLDFYIPDDRNRALTTQRRTKLQTSRHGIAQKCPVSAALSVRWMCCARPVSWGRQAGFAVADAMRS
jgi:transposase InsO family protein